MKMLSSFLSAREVFSPPLCELLLSYHIIGVVKTFVLVAESRVNSAIRAIRAEGRSHTSPDSPHLRFQESDVALWETKDNIYTEHASAQGD
ncbi:uncharacterized protein CCOS01_09416 [Colletotrichum costaricense]|uniref:Uncharacterized protein n=1 Tax=Colletotrichum costaricense TaxID=1209916 RepID=A0AAI9YV84_9PEZI|nr:uncharacterized protein CCOS01_09416 [Colletotrichum costaricense]KAK1524329.1 hypothetical protein CCOS01_09416 [Colletotrichum costaricense]